MIRCKYCGEEKTVRLVYYVAGGVEYACDDCISKPENMILQTPSGIYYKSLDVYKGKEVKQNDGS